jgi:hypothetical protein
MKKYFKNKIEEALSRADLVGDVRASAGSIPVSRDDLGKSSKNSKVTFPPKPVFQCEQAESRKLTPANPFSDRHPKAAIYLIGQGSYRNPRLIELQHMRIKRYRRALENKLDLWFDCREGDVFIDLNDPRSEYSNRNE